MLKSGRVDVTDEQARIEELRRYDVLDTERETTFDRLAELAARLCAAPIALISFVDETRQWCKAEHGIVLGPIARADSFCAHAIAGRELLVVDDAPLDLRFAHSPLVTRPPTVRFYAGAPLVTPRGHALGTVCVLDHRLRRFAREHAQALALLRDEVMQLLESRRELLDLRRSEALREEAVEALLATKIDLEKRVELRTREAEAARRRTEQILARVADGFVALDQDWRYTYVNEQAARTLGRNPDELVGKHIWSEFPEGADQPFQLAYERAMRDQTPVTLVDRYAPWDRWFENRIYPSPEGVSIFFTEITEQRRAEGALRESERRLAEAQTVAHVGSWEWSVATDRVVWSDELFRIYGLGREEFAGTYDGFLSRVYEEDLASTRAVIGDAYRQPGPFVYDHRIVRPDGGVRMLHTRGDVITDGAGQVVRMVGCCWDVTARWEATRELERTAAQLQATLDGTADGVLVVDAEDRVVRCNPPFVALFAVAPPPERSDGAALLAELAARLDDGEALLARAREAREQPETISADRLRLRDGRVLECSGRPYRLADRVAGRVWFFRLVPS
jgi:PAS domain S-box-containing protein